MKEEEIVLVDIMQSDSTLKIRPALILKVLPKYNDLLLCGISSKIAQEIPGIDQVLYTEDDYFAATGLRQTSLVRLLFVAVQSRQQILGSIGKVPDTLHKELLLRLANFLTR